MNWGIFSSYPYFIFVDSGGRVGKWVTQRPGLQAICTQHLFLALETWRKLGLGGHSSASMFSCGLKRTKKFYIQALMFSPESLCSTWTILAFFLILNACLDSSHGSQTDAWFRCYLMTGSAGGICQREIGSLYITFWSVTTCCLVSKLEHASVKVCLQFYGWSQKV